LGTAKGVNPPPRDVRKVPKVSRSRCRSGPDERTASFGLAQEQAERPRLAHCCRFASQCPIGRFRLEPTFTVTDLNDQVWSTAANFPEGGELGLTCRSCSRGRTSAPDASRRSRYRPRNGIRRASLAVSRLAALGRRPFRPPSLEHAAARGALNVAQTPKGRTEFLHEQARLLQRREMSAALRFVKVQQCIEPALCPAPR